MDNLATKVEEIKSTIDNLHSQFSKAFELDHENNISNIERCIRDLKGLQTTVQNAVKILRVVLQRGTKKQIFMSTASHVQQLLDHFKTFHKANEKDVDKSYEWEFESLLKQISDSGKVKEIRIHDRKTELVNDLSKRLSLLSIVREELPHIVPWVTDPTNNSSRLKACQKLVFHLEMKASNAIFLNEKTLLFSTIYSLHLFGLDGRKKRSLLFEFGEKPRFLQNAHYRDEFQMSDGTKITKYMIKREGEVILKKEIELKKTTEGFCFCTDFIVSATLSTITIFKYDPEVTIVKKIEETRVGDIGYVAASWNGEKFAYVTGNTVVCCAADGTEIFRYRNGKLKSPGGLSFDSHDNIYVCTKFFSKSDSGYKKLETGGGVIQVLNDGSTGRVFISDYKNASFIQFCSNGELFLVSDGEKCTIYNLSKD